MVELKKFHAAVIATQQQRWLQFFNQAEQFTDRIPLPDWMQNPTMEQAMRILRRFSEKERDYHQYQARQNYLREQSSIQKDIAQLRQTAEAERVARQQAQQVAQQAQQAVKQAQATAEAALSENAALWAQLAELKARLARKV